MKASMQGQCMKTCAEAAINVRLYVYKTKKAYQDEETLVCSLLVVRDGGEHRQHQAAEHQKKTETHMNTHQLCTVCYIYIYKYSLPSA